MKNLVRLLLLALALALCAALTGCTEEPAPGPSTPCTEHKDSDRNGLCDACGEPLPPPPTCKHIDEDYDRYCDKCDEEYTEKVTVRISMKGEAGIGLAGVTFSIYEGEELIATLETGADGTAEEEIATGRYRINAEGLPLYWTSNAAYADVEINAEHTVFTYTAVNNTPDGSEENPYPAEDVNTGEGAEVEVPAGETVFFTMKGSVRYLIIENADIKVSYNGEEYLPEDGVIRILLQATADTNTASGFAVTNLSSESTAVKVVFASIPGSQDNPYAAALGETVTPEIPKDASVYYAYTAEKDGFLVLYTPTPTGSIMLYNTTSYVVTDYTNGELCRYLPVKTGDKVTLTVTLTEGADPTAVNFTLAIATGSEEDPIPLYASAELRLAAGAAYTLKNTGDAGITLGFSAEGITAAKNGEALTAEAGSYTVTLASGETLTLENTEEERTDLAISVS